LRIKEQGTHLTLNEHDDDDINFHENPYSGSRFVPWGRTDGQTDTTKVIVAFLNFEKAPKKEALLSVTVPHGVLLSQAAVNLELPYKQSKRRESC